jgi:hypothetical protein
MSMGTLAGEARIRKFRQGEARPYEVTRWTRNAVVESGRGRFLDIMRGSSTDAGERLSGSARIDIRTGVDGAESEKVISGTTSGPTFDATNHRLTFSWTDDTGDVYTPTQLRPQFADGEEFAHIDITEGEKPTGETWQYEYRVRIVDGAPGSGQFMEAGLNHLMNLLSGASTEPFHGGTTELRIYDSPTAAYDLATEAEIGTSEPAVGGVSRDGLELTYRFTFENADAVGDWEGAAIVLINSPTAGEVHLMADTTGHGTKPSDRVWHYDWKISV